MLIYQEALDVAQQKNGNIHLLLGNGFSIAWKKDIFHYGSIFEQADFAKGSALLKGAFTQLDTQDFEYVMRSLKSSAILVDHYDPNNTVASKMVQDSDVLRELLVETLSRKHPAGPFEVSENEYACCAKFLEPFTKIYTLNYDLLLYWTIMYMLFEQGISLRSSKGKKLVAKYDDGFRRDYSEDEEGYLTWEIGNTNAQSIYYLHGALHLFDYGYELQKYCWKDLQVRLIDQIRQALSNHRFPLFVSEGTSKEKRTKINHMGYLQRGFKSLESILGSLFVFGHSLSDNDDHVFESICKGKVEHLFVGIFAEPESPEAKRIQKKSLEQASRRSQYSSKELNVIFYDARTTQVWR